MFRNKVDVDRHVAKTLAKVKTDKDRKFRAFSIARLYFDVGDCESCVKYVTSYLTVKDDYPAAHNLLGQSYQKLGMVDRALTEYKASLNLDPNQNNLVLKVCELLTSSDIPVDAGSARYWAERASAISPDHPALFALKATILKAQGAGAPATLALLKAETQARPNDPVPHARLLRHLTQSSTLKESFNYAFETYFSYDNFNNLQLWNEAVSEALAQYGVDQFGWQYWMLRLTVLEKSAEISLAEGRGPSDATAALWKFDRALFEASQCLLNHAPNKVLAAEALSHFGGQLCLHAATLLLKKAVQEPGWRESVRAAAPLFLLALQPVMHLKPPSVPSNNQPAGSPDRLLYTWYIEGAYRRLQAGYTLRNCSRERKNIFIDKISQYCSGNHWRDKLYRKLFTNKEHLERTNLSYLLNASELAEVNIHIPKLDDLNMQYKFAGLLKPDSLHHQIWLGMTAENLSSVTCFGMDELRFSVNNLSNCGAETLNKLDIDTFLYCSIITAKQNDENERKSGYWDQERPHILPAILTPQLCTSAQNKWWVAMWKTGGAGKGDITDVRMTLTRGIETVRCVGSHGLDPELLMEVARVFASRSQNTNDATVQKFLEARANILYSAGVPLLERIRNNISIRPLEKRLFEYSHGELPPEKLDALIEEGKLYLAVQCMNNKDNDKAIEILETIKSPYASFHLYKIFKKLSDEITPERERSDSDKKGKHILYLTKAREFLYLTMDRLKAIHADSDHPLYVEMSDHIENVEQALLKTDMLDRTRHGDGLVYTSDEDSLSGSVMMNNKNTSLALTTYTPRSIRRRRNEVPPSPESLEAQIRQLQKKNSVMAAFVEQAKVLVESNKMLVDEVKDMKKALGEIKNYNIEDTIQEQFKNLKVSVEEAVVTKINEYKDENAADVADLKKELNELKLELSKLKSLSAERQQQLDENEMLMLEEEAGAYFPRQAPAPQLQLPSQHYPAFPPSALYSLYGQYPGVPSLFPGALFPDKPVYTDLVVPPPPPITTTAAAPIIPTAGLALPEQPPQPVIHNYHIPLPQKTTTFQNMTPTKPVCSVAQPDVSTPINKVVLNLQNDATSTPKPFSFTDTSKLANSSGPKPFSFLNSPSVLEMSQNKSGVDKSRTLSERSTDSYDPIPDFKPIIDLPDEVPVSTGEENEEEYFVSRAKLFRFVEKEWKERGLGNIKILKNKLTGKYRVLMRRERVHTVCANHIVTSDIEISPMKDKDKAYFWGANDFADNEIQYEKFCIRFKTVEIGKEFYEKFSKAIEDSKLNTSVGKESSFADTSKPMLSRIVEEKRDSEKPSLGGLTFVGTPTIKPSEPVKSESNQVNPFSTFTFNKPTSLASMFSLKSTSDLAPAVTSVNAAGDDKMSMKNIIYETSAKISTVSANAASFHDKGQAIVRITKDKDAVLTVIQEGTGEIWYRHEITKANKFEPVLQLNTLSWKDPSNVTYRATFLNSGVYNKFHEIAIDCVSTASQPNSEKENESAGSMIPTTISGWGDKFKPSPGSWNCNSCYINNGASDVCCVACNTPKDPNAAKKEDKNQSTTVAPKFSFGIPAAEKKDEKVASAVSVINTPVSDWGDKFKPDPGSWSCKSCYINNKAADVYCVACECPKNPDMPKKEVKQQTNMPAPKFSFGIPAANTVAVSSTTSTTTTSGISSSIFGTNTSFSFGIPQQKTDAAKPVAFGDTAATIVPNPFPQKNTFQFTMKPKSPAKDKDTSVKTNESDNEYASEDDGDHIVFAPIIPLPNKVEIKTGEEDEEVLYVHKAKLYRFAEGEWKECGVGNIKILKHNQTKKLRVLMRREPINKICLNHILNDTIQYTGKDERSWLFCANDFSKEELTITSFCVRFQTKTVAGEFLEAVNKARSELAANTSTSEKTEQQKSDEEVEFVSETKATEEEKEKAKKLMLPENFYNYQHKEPCKGCVGCDPDNYVFSSTPASVEEVSKVDDKTEKTPLKTTSFDTPKSQTAFTPVTGSIFSGKPETNSGSVITWGEKTDPKTPPNAATGQGLFSSNIFSTTPGKSIFGNTNNAANAQSNFALKPPTFGTPVFGSNQSSLFKAPAATTTSSTTTQAALLFGQAAKAQESALPFGSAGSLLGKAFGTPDSKSILTQPTFGQTAEKPLFGQVENKPLFGQVENKPLFGQVENKPLFGQVENKPLFGQSDTNVFGQTNNQLIFGSNKEPKPFGSLVKPALSSNPENGEKESIFKTSADDSNKVLFSGKSDLKSFSDLVKPAISSNPENGEKESILKSSTPILGGGTTEDLSFSALAAKTKDTSTNAGDESKSFLWAGAGTPVFGGIKSQPTKLKMETPEQGGDNKESHEGAGDENYDPHYEPIVPLPSEVKVVTGEEDEVVIFEHRAKLYRFITEWKERGTGDFKLLHHPEKNTYRLLLRQSQVYKTVLNQRVMHDTQMVPQAKSDRALMWAGINYTEDNPEGMPEKLAIKFKNSDVCDDFLGKFNAILENISETPNQSLEDDQKEVADVIPTTVHHNEFNSSESSKTGDKNSNESENNSFAKNINKIEEVDEEGEGEDEETEEEGDNEDYQGDYYGDEYYDYYEGQDDDEDLAVMYESEAVMDGRSVQLVLYGGQHGGHLRIFADDELTSETSIVNGALMERKGAEIRWKGIDEEDTWKFAILPDIEHATNLHASFNDLV